MAERKKENGRSEKSPNDDHAGGLWEEGAGCTRYCKIWMLGLCSHTTLEIAITI